MIPTQENPKTSEGPGGSSSYGTSKTKLILILGCCLALVVMVLYFLLSTNATDTSIDRNSDEKSDMSGSLQGEKTPDATSAGGLNTLVYGTWTGSSSVIKAVNIENNNTTELATLPVNIKKVSILSPENIIYINQTDERDHGRQIVAYNIADQSSVTIVEADDGFGIDDYILSPNKKYMAVWEVSFREGSEILGGGRSRVYTVDLSRSGNKSLIFDETANIPVHYPRAILDNGRVFADRFFPNDPAGGAGWAYGMSVVDFDGSNRQEVESMQTGTYGTQPELSPEGGTLVFAGYDGALGEGTELTDEGYRRAIQNPNTIELLDIQTLERRKLPNLPNSYTYANVGWSTIPGRLTITRLSSSAADSSVLSYNTDTGIANEVNLFADAESAYSFISKLSANKNLLGSPELSQSTLGNLGEGYSEQLKAFYIQTEGSDEPERIGLQDTFAQYITALPGGYFQNVLGAKAYAQAASPTFAFEQQNDRNSLQLQTFFMKTELAEKRVDQQTQSPNPIPNKEGDSPKCNDLCTAQCGSLINAVCFVFCRANGSITNACHDSPLYLYGQEGENIKVKVHTPVYNDTPSYNDGYEITLGTNGLMHIGGQIYDAINYDYRSNARIIRPPSYGAVAKKSEVSSILRKYGTRLGLNEKEITDLVKTGNKSIHTPYAFVSFFNQRTSEHILPLEFYPEPDNYLNVVFYFKNLEEKPRFTPVPPTFGPPLERSGLTAVEVSEIVE